MTRTRRTAFGLALAVAAALVLCGAGKADGPAHTTPVVVHVERGGFHWSDASVGAVGGIGLALALCGCVALVRVRHEGISSATKGDRP